MPPKPSRETYPGTTGQEFSATRAFVALKADGSAVTWGYYPGIQVAFPSLLLGSGVTALFSNPYAFAALKSNGSVVTWGIAASGGNSDTASGQLTGGVTTVFSTYYAFAALKSDGSVVAWGDPLAGGNTGTPLANANPVAVSAQLASGVATIYASTNAFAALKTDGSVVTWGWNYSGGDSSAVTAQLASGVTHVYATANAFAALKDDGSLVTWGNPDEGGDSSAVSSFLGSGVAAVYSTSGAFAALKTDGSVVTWGQTFGGGNSAPVADQLTSDVVAIYATFDAFAAVKSDGSVVTWGSSGGGDSSAVSSLLQGGVATIYATGSAFAAVKTDGSVVTWGDSAGGGDSSLVSADLAGGVVSIYATRTAFAAVKADGSVVTWGDSGSGGDSSAVSSLLADGVAQIYATSAAFAALKTDGSVVTWGNSLVGGDTSSATGDLSSGVVSLESIVAPACFAAGTRILTARGEIAVEDLTTNDEVPTLIGGGLRRVRWIGQRSINLIGHGQPWDVQPVLVAPHAFGPGRPHSALRLSPDHAILTDAAVGMDGPPALIPARYLVNGATIVQQAVPAVTYYHVELEDAAGAAVHDVVLAQGLPAETFLDTGNRSAFANGGPVTVLRPEFARATWEAQGCAGLVVDGPRLASVRTWLLANARLLGHATTSCVDLHLCVNGVELRPDWVGGEYRFNLSTNARSVRLVSRTTVPGWINPASNDMRQLGVAVTRIVLDGRPIALCDPRLGKGWHATEGAWRWTTGDAELPCADGRVLEISILAMAQYWIGDAASQKPLVAAA